MVHAQNVFMVNKWNFQQSNISQTSFVAVLNMKMKHSNNEHSIRRKRKLNET